MSPRAQVSTEYLVLLSVVLIIAVLVAANYSGFSTGMGSSDQTSKMYWRSAEIGFQNWRIFSNGTVDVAVRNNVGDKIKLTSVKLGGEELLTESIIMRVGDTKDIRGQITPGNGSYSLDVNFEYDLL